MSNVIIAPPNLNAKAPAQRFRGGNLLPPPPPILGLNWRPPAQSSYTVQGTTPDRLMLFANADGHDWQEYVPDVPNAKNPTGGGVLVNYWDGKPAAEYTLTLRAYWCLVPQSYTQVPSGEIYTLTFTTENGIST